MAGLMCAATSNTALQPGAGGSRNDGRSIGLVAACLLYRALGRHAVRRRDCMPGGSANLSVFSLSPLHLERMALGLMHSSGMPASAATFSTSIVLPAAVGCSRSRWLV